jgi:hypothetical protein
MTTNHDPGRGLAQLAIDFAQRRNEVIEGVVAGLLFDSRRITRIVTIEGSPERTLVMDGDTALAGVITERDGLTFRVRVEEYPEGRALRTFFAEGGA